MCRASFLLSQFAGIHLKVQTQKQLFFLRLHETVAIEGGMNTDILRIFYKLFMHFLFFRVCNGTNKHRRLKCEYIRPTTNVSYNRPCDISYSLWLTCLSSSEELSIGRRRASALTLSLPCSRFRYASLAGSLSKQKEPTK